MSDERAAQDELLRKAAPAHSAPALRLPRAASFPDIKANIRFRASLRQLPEQVLVARTRNGDVRAFEILVNRYEKRLLRVVLGILNDPDDAVEVVVHPRTPSPLPLPVCHTAAASATP